MNGPTVAVIGGGAAGTLAAAHLINAAARGDQTMELVLLDPRAETGQGIAYSTTDDQHRLNVPAARMSAYPDDPGHFLRWLQARRDATSQPDDFAPRRDYACYLADVLDEAMWSAAGRVRLVRRYERVVGIAHSGLGAARLQLDSGRLLTANAVVFALGALAPSTDWAPETLRRSDRFVPDPWSRHALTSLDDHQPVLLVGTGLTIVDVALTLDRPGRVLHAVSRHGWLPATHAADPLLPMPAPDFPETGWLGLADVRRRVRAHVSASLREHGDWRPAVDGLRCVSSLLWQRLSYPDQREFLAGDARQWEVHRHRMAPSVGKRIELSRRAGRLRVRAGDVVAVTDGGDMLQVTLSDRTQLDVGWVVNCTGPRLELDPAQDPLVDDLFGSGNARPGPHGIGLDTVATGQVRGDDGVPRPWLWTLGAARRGQLWESTAIPEIRDQAASITGGILSFLGIRSARFARPAVGRLVGDNSQLAMSP